MPDVEANGLTLEYESMGDAGHPAIVLVMGLGAQMILWPDPLCAAIADAGFRVIRFDNRDCGRSTVLDSLGMPNVALSALRYYLHMPVRAPYGLDDMARDTVALMDVLRIERAHLVGSSMGGMIAQHVAVRHPQRVASLISISSTTGSRSLPGPTPRARRALLQPPAAPGDIEGAVRRMMTVLTEIGSRTHPAGRAWLRALCERHVARGNHPAGAVRQLTAIVADGDRTSRLRSIRAPALVLHGDEDPLLKPACGIATADAIRAGGGEATLEIVRGMGHDLPLPLVPQIAESIVRHCSRND
jgi:proline iminopeptidase